MARKKTVRRRRTHMRKHAAADSPRVTASRRRPSRGHENNLHGLRWRDLPVLDSLPHESWDYEEARDRLCDVLSATPTLDTEIGIVVLMDADGDWGLSDIVRGRSGHVTYDFSDYYSRDPEINSGLRFPQGTVHYHPKTDTELNYLPSLGDIWNSIEMATETGGIFGCGVINHQGIGTLTFVSKEAYDDKRLDEYIQQYNTAYSAGERQRAIEIESEAIRYMIDAGLLWMARWQCDQCEVETEYGSKEDSETETYT